MNKRIWWHGTTKKNADNILKDGKFKKDTWFAKHLEDALKFGGKYIFAVLIEVDKAPLGWQIHLSNKLSTDKVLFLDKFGSKRLIKNKILYKEFFGK